MTLQRSSVNDLPFLILAGSNPGDLAELVGPQQTLVPGRGRGVACTWGNRLQRPRVYGELVGGESESRLKE